jgi:hypothetical protein
MSGFVDFARLREQLDMAQVIEFLGLQNDGGVPFDVGKGGSALPALSR